MKRITNIPQKIIVIACVAVFAAAIYFSPYTCLILEITGIRCPGCGMTRALISALRLDFASAFSYHFMFWSVPILFWCFLVDGRLFKKKILNIIFYILIVLGFAANWIYHLIFQA